MAVEFVECDEEVEDCYDYYNGGDNDENYLSVYPEYELFVGLVLLVVAVLFVVVVATTAGF
jgi:hypothetical protein